MTQRTAVSSFEESILVMTLVDVVEQVQRLRHEVCTLDLPGTDTSHLQHTLNVVEHRALTLATMMSGR